MPRRERWDIIGSILDAIEQLGRVNGTAPRLSNVATRANLPYDRLLQYLQELHAAGLISGERAPQLTPKGREFLQQYRAWREVLERFGVGGEGPPRL